MVPPESPHSSLLPPSETVLHLFFYLMVGGHALSCRSLVALSRAVLGEGSHVWKAGGVVPGPLSKFVIVTVIA